MCRTKEPTTLFTLILDFFYFLPWENVSTGSQTTSSQVDLLALQLTSGNNSYNLQRAFLSVVIYA